MSKSHARITVELV